MSNLRQRSPIPSREPSSRAQPSANAEAVRQKTTTDGSPSRSAAAVEDEDSDDLVECPPDALRNAVLMNVSAFFHMSSYGRYAALYFIQMGMSATQVGTLAFLAKLVTGIVGPMLGALADRTGKARRIFVAGCWAMLPPFFCLLLLPSLPVESRFTLAVPVWFLVACAWSSMSIREALILACVNGRTDYWGRARLSGAAS